jgi:hypothetical protein
MKVGDKVLCKKDFSLLQNDEILFHKDRFYEITKIFFVDNCEEHFGISFCGLVEQKDFEKGFKNSYWFEIFNENGRVRHFSLTKMLDLNYFNEYFYSTKETRKNNLLKINELCKSPVQL